MLLKQACNTQRLQRQHTSSSSSNDNCAWPNKQGQLPPTAAAAASCGHTQHHGQHCKRQQMLLRRKWALVEDSCTTEAGYYHTHVKCRCTTRNRQTAAHISPGRAKPASTAFATPMLTRVPSSSTTLLQQHPEGWLLRMPGWPSSFGSVPAAPCLQQQHTTQAHKPTMSTRIQAAVNTHKLIPNNCVFVQQLACQVASY